MSQVFFYHLTQSTVDQAARMLATKCLQAGWRVAALIGDEARLAWLDEKLWEGSKEAFLPHGLGSDPHADLQPVLLCAAREQVVNRPQVYMSIFGSELTQDMVNASQRSMVVFDGTDPEAVAQARLQWKALTSVGCAALYWSEESGSWQQKASANV